MSQIRATRTGVAWPAYHAAINTLCVCILATAIFTFSFIASPSPALADNTISSNNGAIFHSKGWVTPAIYKKAAKPGTTKGAAKGKSSKPKIAQKAPAKSKLKKNAKAQKSSVSKRSSKLRRAARARLPNSKRQKRSAKRRIPARVVKRRERTIRRAARQTRNTRAYAVKVASLGVDLVSIPRSMAAKRKKRKKSITGGGGRITWSASSRCVPGRLRAAINYVARNFGRVRVNSTCRSRKHNRRVGGASRSWHLKSRAADFRVFGNVGKTARYLRRVVGGYKHYGGGLFHIDTGPRRSW
ncbi:MAG: hypothetical protein ACI89J_004307 [Hyphomicrobiaceae bacterium]|jgi:hypothetical protein